jgi:hypothetical protein
MAIVRLHAVVSNQDGIGERVVDFEASDEFLELPVDEIVEVIIRYVGESDDVRTPPRYELNFANIFPERRVICAIGALLFDGREASPFMAMIGPA